jgi:hypothetical protein
MGSARGWKYPKQEISSDVQLSQCVGDSRDQNTATLKDLSLQDFQPVQKIPSIGASYGLIW